MAIGNVPDFVRALEAGGGETGQLVARHRTDPVEARLEGWPEWVHGDLRRAFEERGITSLYLHQRQAADALHAGKNTVVATPTSSGKSLCYHLPVLDVLLREGMNARALYLFPTKALARDQMDTLEGVLKSAGRGELNVAVYDGDTPPAVRRTLREGGHLVITNPHMLHAGILPNHTKWQGLFSGLRYIVLDEVHTLSGIYGCHVANIIRRLKRICAHYGSNPVFCASSATIGNPAEHARRLLEVPVELVDEDGSAQGPKHWLFVNPTLVSEASGMRLPAMDVARQLSGQLMQTGLQSIYFTRSRNSMEVLLKYVRDEAAARQVDQNQVAGYRGGYLPNLRRSIERGLRSGEVKAVVSTSALELGIDVGSLDVCVLVGYPGTVSSTFQRAGRVGRRQQASAVLFVARSFAMDQFLIQNPGWLFDVPRDNVTIDPDNPIVLANHVKCSAFELPFRAGQGFGETPDLHEVLEFLADDLGVLARHGEEWHYADLTYPAEGVSLHAADMDNVVIQDSETRKVLAEIDRPSAITEVYEGAIYGHQGEQYLVEAFHYDDRRAYVKRVDADWFTEAETETEVRVLHIDETSAFTTYEAHLAEVHVSTLAKAFKKIKFYTRENVGIGEIHLPPEEFETEACVLALRETLVDELGMRKGAEAACLSGVGELVQGLVPLFARVNPGDVRVTAEVRHPVFECPTLTIYDRVPNGVGLSQRIFTIHGEILAAARGVVTRCSCRGGCPSCIGPAIEAGPRSKPVVLAILDGMLQGQPVPGAEGAPQTHSRSEPMGLRPASVGGAASATQVRGGGGGSLEAGPEACG